mgnify:CR=1 FL=1
MNNALQLSILANNLPEDSSWADVTRHYNNKRLKEYVANLNLPEDSSWADVTKHYNNEKLNYEVIR